MHFIDHHLAKRLYRRYRGLCCHHCRTRYRVQITIGTKSIKTVGLYDTGNQLYEPIRRKPVSLIQKELAVSLFDEKTEWERRFRIIPYSSIGVQNGLLKGFVADELKIFEKGDVIRCLYPVLAITEQPFGQNRGYKMILHPKLF